MTMNQHGKLRFLVHQAILQIFIYETKSRLLYLIERMLNSLYW